MGNPSEFPHATCRQAIATDLFEPGQRARVIGFIQTAFVWTTTKAVNEKVE